MSSDSDARRAWRGRAALLALAGSPWGCTLTTSTDDLSGGEPRWGSLLDGGAAVADGADGARDADGASHADAASDAPRADDGAAPGTCSDGVRNGGESDVDCGGATACPRCAKRDACTARSDCASGWCFGNQCY